MLACMSGMSGVAACLRMRRRSGAELDISGISCLWISRCSKFYSIRKEAHWHDAIHNVLPWRCMCMRAACIKCTGNNLSSLAGRQTVRTHDMNQAGHPIHMSSVDFRSSEPLDASQV